MLREEYSEKVMYEVKPEGAEGNLPWEYLGDDDFRKGNNNCEVSEVREWQANLRHIKAVSWLEQRK